MFCFVEVCEPGGWNFVTVLESQLYMLVVIVRWVLNETYLSFLVGVVLLLATFVSGCLYMPGSQ